MFRISRLHEVLHPLSRGRFEGWARSCGADKHSKGFGSWQQMVTMIYGHLSGARSLREIETGFNSQFAHHYHLGCRLVRRSTLAEANARRDIEVFAQTANALMAQTHRALRKEVRPLLYLLDSTPISLMGPGFDDWAQVGRTRHTQGLKLHVMYEARQAVPVWQRITAPNVNDLTAGMTAPVQAGATYVFDKGYCDYNWWLSLQQRDARFVTRFKHNASLRVVDERPIPAEDQTIILADQTVSFANRHPGGGRYNHYKQPLRRVFVAREGDQSPLVLATNDMTRSAAEIARLYKDRWQIELFFKWLKQHLRIKRFLGRSENAVRIQILCALISYLLVALYRNTHAKTRGMKDVLVELRATLFQRPDLDIARYQRRRERIHEWKITQPALFA